MYVVAGVSGNTGSVVADTLLAQKLPVRVVVRDEAKGAPWKAKGAEVAIADLGDQAALAKALTGGKGAYLLVPPVPTSPSVIADHMKLVDAMALAIKASGIAHVVLLSSIGAHLASGTGPVRSAHYAETKLFALGVAVTSVRAGAFYENNVGSLAATAGGTFPTFFRKDLAGPTVGTHDIGLTAAKALLEGGTGISIIELAGPRELSASDIAAETAKILGTKVEVQQGPEEAISPAFQSYGMSADMAGLYQEMIHGFNAGTLRWEGGKARHVRGTMTIDTFVRGVLKR